MLVFYNQVNLELERVALWESRVVRDDSETDHLYTVHRIGVDCLFNPGLAGASGGSPGPAVLQQLRQRLLEPRQPLTIQFNGVVVLQAPLPQRGQTLAGGGPVPPAPLPVPGPQPVSPGGAQPFGAVSLPFAPTPSPPLNNVPVPVVPPPVGPLAQLYRCDCNNGPKPQAVRVTAFEGTKTCLVYFEVEVAEPYESPGAETPSVLLHRWKRTHEIDEQHLTTVTTEGTAVFRPDLLLDQPGQAQRVCDDFRLRLLHAVPALMKRTVVRVTASEDGTSLAYTTVDVEQQQQLGLDNPVIRFEGYFRMGVDNTGSWYKLGLRYASFVIRLWGRATTSRQQLINAAMAAASRLGFAKALVSSKALGFSAPFMFKSDLTVSLDDKHVELNVGAYLDGYLTAAWFGTGINTVLKRAGALLDNFPDDTAPRVLPPGDNPVNPSTPQPQDNPRPPVGGGRGTYIGRLVAQQLTPEWATPARPPNPEPQAVDFTF